MSKDAAPGGRDGSRHFDDERAAAYDLRARQAIPGYEALQHLACMAVAEATGGHGRVLVVGAGTGAECVALAQACPTLTVVGVDPSAAMLAHAEQKIAEHGLTSRVHLYPRDVGGLAPDQRFSAATLLLVMHFIPDEGPKQELLADIATVLEPGAPLVLADLYGSWDDPWQQQLRTIWRHLQLAAGIAEADVDKGFRHVDRDIHPVTEARLAELLAAAGFGPPQPFFRALCFAGWVARKL